MGKEIKQKKRVVVSYSNITEELQLLLYKRYPMGYTDHMIRVDKGTGEFFYAVVLDTEEVSYLIKIDVKIDDLVEEGEDEEDDDDKDGFFDDEIKGAEDIPEDGNDSDE